VLIDGEVRAPSHGVDVDEDATACSEDGRMYQLLPHHDAVRDRTLKITFLEPGAEAYAFTFGVAALVPVPRRAWRPRRRSAGRRAVLGVS
jgi:hypothetical protein